MEGIDERRNWERFGEMVLAEPELHNRLRAAADQAAFIALAVKLGLERECEFSAPLVQTMINEKRRAWLERWL